jgi:hypothetical protein
MKIFSRPRRGFVLVLGGLLSLAVGLLGGTWFERYYGSGGIYMTMEDALATHHISSKLSRESLQDVCLGAMADSLGDVHTMYIPRARPAETVYLAPGEPVVSAPAPKPVVAVRDLTLPDRRIAVIRLEHFIEEAKAAELFWSYAQSAHLADRDGLIVDLRGNPGGRIRDAASIASAWTGQRLICSLENRSGATTTTYDGPEPAVLAPLPTALLVDGSTASAAEIFAGALQDYGLARLFGRLTYGKGVTTKPNDLGNGRSFIYSDYYWFTPKHRTVQRLGLVPEEIVVEPDGNDCRAPGEDVILERAVAWLRTKPRRQ